MSGFLEGRGCECWTLLWHRAECTSLEIWIIWLEAMAEDEKLKTVEAMEIEETNMDELMAICFMMQLLPPIIVYLSWCLHWKESSWGPSLSSLVLKNFQGEALKMGISPRRCHPRNLFLSCFQNIAQNGVFGKLLLKAS